jgi:hypothetical protein
MAGSWTLERLDLDFKKHRSISAKVSGINELTLSTGAKILNPNDLPLKSSIERT